MSYGMKEGLTLLDKSVPGSWQYSGKRYLLSPSEYLLSQPRFTPSEQSTVDRLEAILLRWRADGVRPTESLSTFEEAALWLAAGRELEMTHGSPLLLFVCMDAWLQRWVMNVRGW